MRRRPGGQVSWSRRIGPPFHLLLDVSSPPPAPVSRLPQRRDRVPSRCGPSVHTARRVKAAQEVVGGGGGALALALTAVLDSGPRTGGKRTLTSAVSQSQQSSQEGMLLSGRIDHDREKPGGP
jgi:hypothetical protein